MLLSILPPSKHFKYSSTVHGHEADVRDLSESSSCELITCSRDMTAKLWKRNIGSDFEEILCYKGHKSFVSCVAFFRATSTYPEGLVITGGNDHKILVFNAKTADVVACLSDHSNTVCSINVGQSGALLSSSWDKTAKLWNLSNLHVTDTKSQMTLSGHNAAVWDAIEMPRGDNLIVTASADRTVKLWRSGHCVFTLTDHKDCVRGLASLTESQFLSCSNDTTIKRWSIEGNCLQTYYGHRSFVYSVVVSNDFTEFLTAGEDRTMRVWDITESHPKQTISTPATSVWKAIYTKTGDVAGACSDATVRIFTRSEDKVANQSAKATFEEELAASQIPASASNMQGDVDIKSLPGKEALQTPGNKDGQTKLVRNESGVVEVFQWSMSDMEWIKVGNMIEPENDRKKTEYKGKEYDYLFTIDIEEGKPPLNLPYNVTEDPWVAAQKFIDDNDLSQSFLETIANFIIENSDVSMNSGSASQYADPFTGGGRYVPEDAGDRVNGSNADPFTGGGRYIPGESSTNHVGMPKADPFTGGGRYIPGSSNGDPGSSSKTRNDPMVNPSRYVPGSEEMDVDVKFSRSAKNSFYPKHGFILFETANVNAMMTKLKDLLTAGDHSEMDADALCSLIQSDKEPDSKSVNFLWNILNGDMNSIFPALDLLRLALVRCPAVGKILCNSKAEQLLSLILRLINQPKRDAVNLNRLLAIRILCNLVLSDEGIACLIAGYETVLSAVSSGDFLSDTSAAENKNIQVAVATLYINYAVVVTRQNPPAVLGHCQKVQLFAVSPLLKCLEVHGSVTAEACFRYLVALGTLLVENDVAQTVARSMDASHIVNHVRKHHGSVDKIVQCTSHLLLIL
uniref:Phospholipase A-2-activating protein n=1 Tax=Phallusia mammillata TaxID=59560 RepID=A0A6F9DPV1_9ASCI|nr:phospholipase A-2-activating protein [Phallusia mammillata]